MAYVPSDAVAYIHVQDAAALPPVHTAAATALHPDIWRVLSPLQAWSAALVPYDGARGTALAPLLVLESDAASADAAVALLRNGGYESTVALLPLGKRAVIAASPSLSVVRMAAQVAARERPDYRHNISAAAGLRAHAAAPATVSVRVQELANRAPQLEDPLVGLIAGAVRSGGVKVWSAGITAAGDMLMAASDGQLSPTLPAPTDTRLAFSVDHAASAARVAANLLEADRGEAGMAYRAIAERIRRTSDLRLPEIFNIAGEGRIAGSVGADGWALLLDPSASPDAVGSAASALLAGVYPEKQAFRLRDGGTGYAWAAQADVRVEEHDGYRTVTDGSAGHDLEIRSTDAGVLVGTPNTAIHRATLCTLGGGEDEYIYLKLAKNLPFSDLELHKNGDTIGLCLR